MHITIPSTSAYIGGILSLVICHDDIYTKMDYTVVPQVCDVRRVKEYAVHERKDDDA